MAKQRRSADLAAVMHSARPHWQAKSQVTPRALLPGNCQMKVMLLVQQPVQQPAKPQLLELRDSLPLQALEILRARARARQCLRGPGPFAFFREIRDAQKCNPAAHYGDSPIFARYRWRRSQREPAGYGNRRIRWLRKRARPAGTFPIVAADKCPSPLRRIQD